MARLLGCWMALVLAASTYAVAQEQLPRDPAVRAGKLPNGLSYFVRSNSYPPGRIALMMAVRAGSLHEEDDQLGLAHLLEHMLFATLPSFPNRTLTKWLARYGVDLGPHANAFTGYHETVYFVASAPLEPPAFRDSLLQVFAEMAFAATLDSAEIETERRIVLEEWRLGLDAEERIWRRFHNAALYGNSRYAERDPIGTEQSLRTFRPEAVRRFYRRWYRPELLTVMLVGDIAVDTLEALVRRHFGRIRAPEEPVPSFSDPEIPSSPGIRISVGTDPELRFAQVQFNAYLPPLRPQTRSEYRRFLLRRLALGILLERLDAYTYTPDAPAQVVFADIRPFSQRYDWMSFSMFAVRDESIATAAELLAYELARAWQGGGVSQSELERHKAKLQRRLQEAVAEQERTESVQHLFRLRDHAHFGMPLLSAAQELELAQSLLPTIRREEVEQVFAELFPREGWVVLVSAREQPGRVAPDSASLWQAIQRGLERGLRAQPQAEEQLPALLAQPPRKGRILRQRRLPAGDALEWTLSNGARVVVKPTQLKQDQVIVWALSPGGHSLAPDSLYWSAAEAMLLVEQCGAGEFDPFTLHKRLAGQKLEIRLGIGETGERIWLEAGAQELELALQLLHLYMTRPRMDSACVEAYRAARRSLLQGRTESPQAVFFDTLQALYWQGHPRKRAIQLQDLQRVNPAAAYEFYRQRVSNAADWVFIVVGAVKPEQLRPLVERYLAGLPGDPRRRERPRDVGARPAPVGTVVQFERGDEPKTWVGIVYGGEFRWSVYNQFRLEALERLLNLRLFERLREELGGVYAVFVWTWAEKEPLPHYRLQIAFSCDPDRADTLVQELYRELERLRTQGPTLDEVERVQRVLLHDYQLDQQRNEFWATLLQRHYRDGDALEALLSYPQWLEQQLTPALLRQTVAELCAAPRLEVRMLPPKTAQGQ
jgi:zinc protease